MITALSLNPCLDKTMTLDCFDPDAPNRVEIAQVDLGGKGVNVARVLSVFPGEHQLMGFDFEGSPVEKELGEKLPCHLIRRQGALRINLKIREASGRTIEINERGAKIEEEALRQMEERLLSSCPGGSWAALCGSLPPGAPVDTYQRLCRKLKEKGCFVAVDCDGPALISALEAGPDLIKPNAQEFFTLTGADASDLPSALIALRKLHEKAAMICLSMGPEGAVLSTREGAVFCPAADVPVRGTQGAGDSMLAGLLMALERGESPGEALRFASAVAGASVMLPGPQLCRMEDALAICQRMPVWQGCS